MAGSLTDYIKEGLKRGYSESDLRQILISQGWGLGEINQAFASVHGVQEQPPQPPQAQPAAVAKKMKIRRLGVFSFAKMSALVSAVVGLVVGLFITMPILLLGGSLDTLFTVGDFTGADVLGVASILKSLGILIIFAFPAIAAVLGFMMGAFSAFVYNMFARFVGGYEIEFKE